MQLATLLSFALFGICSHSAYAASSFWEYWQSYQNRNPDYQALQHELESAQAQDRVADAAFWPKLSTGARFLNDMQNYQDYQVKSTGTELSLKLEQSLIDIKTWSEKRQAIAESRMRAFEVQQKVSEMKLRVLQTYWRTVLLKERSLIYRSQYEPLIKKVGLQGEAALEEALRSKHDETQWLLGFSQMQLQAMQNQDDLESNQEQLSTWIDAESVDPPSRPESFKPNATWIKAAMEHSQSASLAMQSSFLRQRKDETLLQVARSNYFPRLFLFADWQRFQGTNTVQSSDPINPLPIATPSLVQGNSFGIALDWVLFEGFRTVSNARTATFDLAASRQLHSARRKDQSAVRHDQNRRLQSLLSRFDQLERLRTRTRESLAGILQQQKAGLLSFDALVPALSRSYETEALYYQTLGDFFELYWKVLQDQNQLDDAALKRFSEACQGTNELRNDQGE